MVAHRGHLFGYFLLYLFVFGVREHLHNKRGNLLYFLGAEASCCNSWSAQSDAAGDLGWSGVGGNGVPVYQYASGFKDFLSDYAGYSGLGEVN